MRGGYGIQKRTKLYDTQFGSQTDLQANLLSNLHKTIVNHNHNSWSNSCIETVLKTYPKTVVN